MPKPSRLTGLILFLGTYFVCLAFLLPLQSLWLDEILGLIGVLTPDWPSLIAHLRTLPGNTPVGPLILGIPIRLAGYSVFAARLPSAVFSVAACAGTFVLANRLRLRRPLLAVLLFAACPLQFRYAIEARPYSLVLCLSVWSTVIFLHLLENPRSWVLASLYGVLAVVGIYVFAYALFVPAAHFLWLLASPKRPTERGFKRWSGNRRVMAVCGASIALAVLSIVPWYLYVRQDWKTYTAALRLGSFLDGRPIAVIAHELTGAGYVGNALLVLGAIVGIKRVGSLRGFWIAHILFPVVLVIAGDLAFGYFLAIRQLIFVLPPLILLFAAGTEAMDRFPGLWSPSPQSQAADSPAPSRLKPVLAKSINVLGWKGCLLLAVFLAASLYSDVSWFRKPREDWQAAAAAAVAQKNACISFVPPDAERLYLFFRPELRARECTTETDSVTLAISPYDPDHAYESARRGLLARGLTLKSKQEFTGPRVELYEK